MTLTLVATPDPEFSARQPEIVQPYMTIEEARRTLVNFLDSLFDRFGENLDYENLKEYVAAHYPLEVSLLQKEGLWT